MKSEETPAAAEKQAETQHQQQGEVEGERQGKMAEFEALPSTPKHEAPRRMGSDRFITPKASEKAHVHSPLTEATTVTPGSRVSPGIATSPIMSPTVTACSPSLTPGGASEVTPLKATEGEDNTSLGKMGTAMAEDGRREVRMMRRRGGEEDPERGERDPVCNGGGRDACARL